MTVCLVMPNKVQMTVLSMVINNLTMMVVSFIPSYAELFLSVMCITCSFYHNVHSNVPIPITRLTL